MYGNASQHQLYIGQAVEFRQFSGGPTILGRLTLLPAPGFSMARVDAPGPAGIQSIAVPIADIQPLGTASRAAAPSPDWLDAATNQYINRANSHGRARTAPFVPTGDAAYDQAALWAIRRNGKPGR